MDFEQLIRDYGYWALFVGTFLEGETIVIIAGFMAFNGLLDLKWLIVTAFCGTFLSDQLFFYFGLWKGREFIAKRPKWQVRADKFKPVLEKYKNFIILGFRFFYGLRNVTPLVLGSSGINPVRYLILNFIGAVIWAIAFGTGGYLFGHAVEPILDDVHKYQGFIYAAVAAVGLLFWIRRMNRKRRVESDATLPPAVRHVTPTSATRDSRV